MFRNIILLVVFTFGIGLVGCRSCWGPYDNCQPTFVPEAGDTCKGALYRNGSILGGMERAGETGCATCSGGGSQEATANRTILPVNHTEPAGEYPADENYSLGPVSAPAPSAGPTSAGVEELPASVLRPQGKTSGGEAFLPGETNLLENEFPLNDEG